MWFIGVEVEQETSAPPPKKILDPPLLLLRSEKVFSFRNSVLMHFVNLKKIFLSETLSSADIKTTFPSRHSLYTHLWSKK